MKTTHEGFGDLLRDYMAKAELSSRELGKMVGVSHNLVALVCRGEKTVNPKDLPKWAAKLKVPDADVAHFVELGRSARAHGKADVSAYVEEIEAKLKRFDRLVGGVGVLLASIASHPAMKSKQDELKGLLQQIRSLQRKA